jgi:nicotinate-nucleotide adenylyltransferase
MRTAIFGGTFDPIHSAHLEMARRAADQFRLDRVLFIPAGNPPHKHADASFEHRYRMVQLACAADPRFLASRLEEGAAKSYSIDTIERVKAGSAEAAPSAGAANATASNTGGNSALFFIIGSDAFAEIQSWRRWQDVIRAVEFIVVARPGHEIAGPPGARVHRLESAELPVSSSDIRDALARGESPRELPPAIADYIRDRRLYGSVS